AETERRVDPVYRFDREGIDGDDHTRGAVRVSVVRARADDEHLVPRAQQDTVDGESCAIARRRRRRQTEGGQHQRTRLRVERVEQDRVETSSSGDRISVLL